MIAPPNVRSVKISEAFGKPAESAQTNEDYGKSTRQLRSDSGPADRVSNPRTDERTINLAVYEPKK